MTRRNENVHVSSLTNSEQHEVLLANKSSLHPYMSLFRCRWLKNLKIHAIQRTRSMHPLNRTVVDRIMVVRKSVPIENNAKAMLVQTHFLLANSVSTRSVLMVKTSFWMEELFYKNTNSLCIYWYSDWETTKVANSKTQETVSRRRKRQRSGISFIYREFWLLVS